MTNPKILSLLGFLASFGSLVVPVHAEEPPAEQVPTPTSEGTPLVTESEKSTLMKSFLSSLRTEMQSLRHQHALESKELRASHARALRDWDRKKAQQKEEHFSANSDAISRRKYLDQMELDRRAYQASLRNEVEELKKRQKKARVSLKRNQVEKKKKFKLALKNGERPRPELWSN